MSREGGKGENFVWIRDLTMIGELTTKRPYKLRRCKNAWNNASHRYLVCQNTVPIPTSICTRTHHSPARPTPLLKAPISWWFVYTDSISSGRSLNTREKEISLAHDSQHTPHSGHKMLPNSQVRGEMSNHLTSRLNHFPHSGLD